MAEDILGIVGHADLTDLDKGFEEVIDRLAKVGQYVGRVNNQFESLKHSREASDILISGLTELVEKTREADEEIRKLGDSPQDLDKLLSKLEDYKGKTGEIAIASRAAYFEQKNYVESLKGFADNIEQMAQKAKDTESLQKLASMHSQISDAIDTETERLDALQDQLKKADDTYKHTEEAIKRCTEELEKQSDATEKAGKSVENAAKNTSSVSNWLTGNGKLQEGVDAFKKSLLELPLPISNVTKGLGGMLAAMRAMIATPLGAMLAGITLAFQTLFQWLNKSKDGQIAFAKISAYVGSILSSIGDIVIKVGRYIFKSFTDPQGALHDFGVAVVKGAIAPIKVLIHAIQAVSSTMKALWDSAKGVAMIGMALKSGDWDEFGMYWDKAKNSFKNAGKEFTDAGESMLHTVDNMVEGIYNTVDAVKELGKGVGTIGKDIWDAAWDTDLSNVFSDMLDKANKAKDLAGIQKETEIKISQAKEKEAALDAEIAASREKIYTLTGAERLKEIENLKQLQKSKYDDRIKAYQKMYDIQKATLDLHENTLEDEEKSRQLNIQLLQLKAQQAAATRMTTRLEESTKRTMANEGKRGAKQSAAVSAANARMDESIRSIELQRIQLEHDLEQKIADAKIAAMKEGFQKTQAERKRENEAELDALEEQRKKLIEQEYQRQKKIHQDEQAVIKAKGGKVVNWDDSMFDKSSEEITTINKLMDDLVRLTLQKQKNAEEEIQKQRIQSMRDYLKEYGTMEEKRLAIAQEYDEKIKNAQTTGERLSAMAQKDQALRQFDSQRLSETFNFEDIFNNLGELTLDRLHTVRDQLRDMLSNNDLDFKQYKSIAEQIDKVNQSIVEKEQKENEFLGFRIPGETTIKRLKEEQKEAMLQLLAATRQVTDATTELENKRSDISSKLSSYGVNYNGEIKTSNRNDILADLEKLFSKDSQPYRNIEKGLDELAGLESKEVDSKKKQKNADDKVVSVNSRLSESLKDVRKRVGEFAESLTQINTNIQALPELMDSLGLGDTEIGKAMSGIANSANDAMGAMTDFASGNYVGAAIKAFSAVNGLGETLGLWSNSNVEESEKEIDRLVKSNADLGEALNDLRDELKDMNLSDTSTYRKAQEVANAQIQNGLRIVQTKMGEYEGHHSTNYYSDYATSILKSIAESAMRQGVIDYRKLSDAGAGINELLKYLTPEELDKLRTFDPQGWIRFMDAIRDADKSDLGAADTFLEYVNNYSDLMKELEDEWKETMLNLSWDSLKDSFRSALEDMEKDVESWNDDLDDIFRKGVSNYLSTTYTNKDSGKLAAWYDKYFKAMESGGLDANEVAQLREEYLAIVKEATAERDRLYETLGIVEDERKEQQSATFNSAQNITYEQADSLVGIETAQLIAQEQMRDLLQVQTDAMNDVALQMPYVAATLDNINAGVGVIIETQNSMNNHLAEISVNTAVLPNMRDEIVKMRRLIEEQ